MPLLSTIGFLIEEPTDRIAAFGGLMMPLKKSMPYIPKFVTVKVDPAIASGDNFLSLANDIRFFASWEISVNERESALRITGVSSPPSTATPKDQPNQ